MLNPRLRRGIQENNFFSQKLLEAVFVRRSYFPGCPAAGGM